MSLSSLLDVVLPGYIMVRENSLTAGCSENKLVVCLLQVITSNQNQTKIHTFPSASTLLFRELDHANVIRLIDSCTRPPCIITGETSCYQHLSLDKKRLFPYKESNFQKNLICILPFTKKWLTASVKYHILGGVWERKSCLLIHRTIHATEHLISCM